MPAHGAVRMPAVRRGMLEGTARRGCGARDSRGGNTLRRGGGAAELHGLRRGMLLHTLRRGVVELHGLRGGVMLLRALRGMVLQGLLRALLCGRIVLAQRCGMLLLLTLRGIVVLLHGLRRGVVLAVVVVQGRHAVRLLHLAVLRCLVLFPLRGMADSRRLGRTVQHLVRVLVDGGVQTAVGAHGGGMVMREMRRGAHAVAAVRVMPMAVVPRCGGPQRHQAGRRQRGKREDGHTVGRVTVHGAAVAIAVDGETVGIVAGGRPRCGNTDPHTAVCIAHGGAAVYRVMMNTGA